MKKRILSTLLALFLMLTLLPTAAFAADPPQVLNPKDGGADKISDIEWQKGGLSELRKRLLCI